MQEVQDLQSSFQSIDYCTTQLLCIQKNEASMICSNASCLHRSLVCSTLSCQCNILHKKCLSVSLLSLTSKIQDKMINPQPLIDKVNKIVDHCIDWLSEWRDKMEEEVKFYGLTQKQKNFLMSIQCNSLQDINGEIVSEIIKSLDQEEDILTVKQVLQQISKLWQKQEQKFYDIFKDIEGSICVDSISDVFRSLQSQIVETNKQFETLCNFFPRKVTNLNLLYQASEHQFSVQKFYKKCSYIPQTLVLVHTDYGKKIGGYTPLSWYIHKEQTTLYDQSQTSFTFSLTNNDKFVQSKQSKTSISFIDKNTGPSFGSGLYTCDLTIKDKSDVSYLSYASINSNYYNQYYEQNNTDSIRNFSGGQTKHFKTKQWEVFEVKFE